MGRLERIWVKRMKRGPMDAVERASCRAGAGLVGNANQRGVRQVTVLSSERWQEAERDLGAPVDPSARRANLFVSGVNLQNSRDRVLRVGAVRLRIRGETRPCERMDEAHPGLQEALRPRWGGGCYGEVIEGGDIQVGDAVEWLTPEGEER